MPTEARNIQETLQLPYDRSAWAVLLSEVFPNVAIFQAPQRADRIKPDFVKELLQIGNIRLEDGKNLAVFEASVADRVDLARNRVALRELITGFIDQGTTHGVLCIFNSADPQYRFTFVSKETVVDESGQIVTSETNPRRFTYILGPGESRRTAAERFQELAAKRDRASIADVVDAFSVERLNKEFFEQYKRNYQAFVDHLLSQTDLVARIFGVTSRVGSDAYDKECKAVRDWVKTLLGRIVFVHFVQKKGWMGCKPAAKAWKDGDPQFLKTLFEAAPDKNRFYSERLAPLFFEALSTPDRAGDIFTLTGTKVPYLNGGLFDPSDERSADIDFPAQLFRDLLDSFSAYNFTIDENDPEESQVGIDPEMLGHIFENLLEENRKKGAYYTPKSVVQFMCQQSLLLYLQAELGPHDELETLVRKKDGGENTQQNWVRQNASRIENLLDRLTVCDPAIGSGAFPIGILMEIFWIKLALDWTLNDPQTFADTKRRIIERTIHGVDIDPGAVAIARLRCWLALIVDEAVPRPLPNLEFNIFCADSLVEYLRGEPINLQRLAGDEQTRGLIGYLVKAKQNFFEASSRPAKRKALIDVYQAIAALAHYEFAWMRSEEGLFGETLRAAELDAAANEIDRIQRKIASLRKLGAADQAKGLDQISRWFEDAAKPTFLWHLHFGEILARGGFDIVVANPPYISSESTSNKALLKSRYRCYDASGDTYICFYELGLDLLRSSGILAYITSNQFFRADYGQGLREFVVQHHSLRCIIDVCTAEVFKAAAYPAIVFVEKGKGAKGKARFANWEERGNPHLDLFEKVAWNSAETESASFTGERWLPLDAAKVHFLARLSDQFPPLSSIPGITMRRGVLTGYDAAFLLNEGQRMAIISRDKVSSRIIKPILEGRCLKRWKYESEGTHVLFAQRGIRINDYPSALAHLTPMRARLEPGNKGGRKAGPYQWYEIQDSCAFAHLFEQPKIAWGNLSVRPAFCIVPAGVFLKEPCPFIVGADYWLLALLNSTICHFFVHYTAAVRSGGFREYKPTYVGRLPIPNVSDDLKQALNSFGLRASINPDADQHTLDELAFNAYQLTAEERKLLRGFSALVDSLSGS